MAKIHKHDQAEREFATRLAEALNRDRNTDYQPVAVTREEFPDFHLTSAAGHPKLDVEIVTVPIKGGLYRILDRENDY